MGKIKLKKEMLIYMMLIAVVAIGAGLGDSILNNFYKDAYNINAVQRAFIEFPRELPGVVCVFMIAALSFLGDIKLAVIAQILACLGIMALGIFTPSFGIMCIILFVYSLGVHLFMPLSDSIGMALAEPDKIGQRVGQYGSLKTTIAFMTGIFVFIGFRTGFLSFKTNLRMAFIISAIAYVVAIILAITLVKLTKDKHINIKSRKKNLVFKKEYKYYYMLTILHGVQKQVAYVFGSWVIIDLLLKGTDVMSVLVIVSSFLSIFFFKLVGKWMDQKGIQFVMYLDALSFIVIYVIYGLVVWYITATSTSITTIHILIIYSLFILDRLSMNVGVVKSVYLRNVATDKSDVTSVLSTGVSLDHIVSILAAQVSGIVWTMYGPHWVFFMAAFFSLGNLFVAYKIK